MGGDDPALSEDLQQANDYFGQGTAEFDSYCGVGGRFYL